MKAIRWLVVFIVLSAGGAYLALGQSQLSKPVVLNWSAASGVVSNYFVERSLNPSNSWAEIAVLGPVTTHTDTNLVNGTFYWYRVRAGNPAGRGEYSNVAGALYLLLPGKPGALTITIQ